MNRSKSAPMKKQTTATRKAPIARKAPAARKVPTARKVSTAPKVPTAHKMPTAYRAPAPNRVPTTQKVPTAHKVPVTGKAPPAKQPAADKTPKANKSPRHYSATSAVVTLGIIFSSMASANLKFTEVSEQQLSEIRGKFIARDKVRYFKLEMTTQWTDHTSFDHGTGLSLTMDISDRDNPKASITIGGSLGDRDDSNPRITNPIPATDNIEGISQTIQVSGSGNQIVNRISIDALELRSDQSATAGESAAGGSGASDNLLGNSSQSYKNSSGITTQFDLGGNNIGYAIKTPNNDVVIQKLAHNTALDAGQLAQSVALSNNFQHIVNNVRVQVAFDSLQATRTSALALASQSLIGLR